MLVTRHLKGVFRLVSLWVSSPHDAEDLVQDVFLAVQQALPSFRREARFSTWLYRITLNLVSQHRRRRGRQPQLQAFSDEPSPRSLGNTASILSKREEFLRAQQAIRELPEAYRAAFTLRTAEDLSYQEIAEILGCPLGTVDSRIARARALLAKKLGRP